MKNPDIFEYPTNNFFWGVALTEAAHSYLKDSERNYENFSIEVFDYVNGKTYDPHNVKITIDDYPESIRDKILSINQSST